MATDFLRRHFAYGWRKAVGICAGCCIALAAVFAATLPNSVVGDCMAKVGCAPTLRDVWHDFLAPLTGLLLIGLTLTFALLERGGTRIGILAASLTALLIVAFMMLLALGHNPQEVFCATIQEGPDYQRAHALGIDPPCEIRWHSWLYIGIAWTIPTFSVLLLLYGFARLGRHDGKRGSWPDG